MKRLFSNKELSNIDKMTDTEEQANEQANELATFMWIMLKKFWWVILFGGGITLTGIIFLIWFIKVLFFGDAS